MEILALAAGIVATLGAYALRLFTAGGALTAVAVGVVVLLSGGWGLTFTLVGAFASTAILTAYRRGEKVQPEHKRGRTAAQILANGVVPAGMALLSGVLQAAWPISAAAGAIAASTADTWATELGLLSRRPPRLITTGEIVERGRSGGLTLLGTAAAVGGTVGIGLLSTWLVGTGVGVVAAAALLGQLVDSLLGATVQVRYRCPACGRTGETVVCSCGARRSRLSGLPWMNNEAVNLIAAASAAATAAVLSSAGSGVRP